jgi:hypothetical protein
VYLQCARGADPDDRYRSPACRSLAGSDRGFRPHDLESHSVRRPVFSLEKNGFTRVNSLPPYFGVLPTKAQGALYTLTRYCYALPRSPCSTWRRCDRCTRTPHRPRTRNPSSPLRCFPPWCPAGNPGAHMRLFCLSHDCDFFRVPFRSRAPPPTSTPPSSPPPRAFRCHVTAQS